MTVGHHDLETIRLELADANCQIVALRGLIDQVNINALVAIDKANTLAEGMLKLIAGLEEVSRIDDMKWLYAAREFQAIDEIINHRGNVEDGIP